MNIKEINPKSLEELSLHIKSGVPSLYVSSKTSTVIVYADISLPKGEEFVVNLSSLPSNLEMIGDDVLVKGPVTWQELKAFVRSKGREVMTAPTEEVACVLAGLATSATGERAFGFGPLRDHIKAIKYLDHNGEMVSLEKSRDLEEEFLEYSDLVRKYDGFKNAPFPHLNCQLEKFIGTEGQLGVITEALIKTAPAKNTMFLYFNTPKWEDDLESHFELLDFARAHRGKILACELLDDNSLSFIPKEMRPFPKGDLIFFEIYEDSLEEIFEKLSTLKHIDVNDVMDVSQAKCLELRMTVPRHLYEYYSANNLVKKGTDAQVTRDDFMSLFKRYREMAANGGDYLLFGHFGDCHLHYNFIAGRDGLEKVDRELDKFYEDVFRLQGSPFAEHGIGLIKQKFINNYYSPLVKKTFHLLKEKHDPKNIFFPSGFMGIQEN